jgi:RHS repeat-associated protein
VNAMIFIEYNRDGSMAKLPDTTIEYHAYHRMPTYINGTKLRYNSHGMRICKGERAYRGFGAAIVERADGEELCFINSPNGPIFIRSGGAMLPVTRNRQQSFCACGNSLVHYAPFGDFISFGNLPRRMFTGYEYDAEWGMYNARKRLYAPNLRTFVSVDPKFQYASPYLYCMSDPFNSVDPTGEISVSTIIDAVINAATIVASIVVAVLTWGAATPDVVAADVAVTGAERASPEVLEAYAESNRALTDLVSDPHLPAGVKAARQKTYFEVLKTTRPLKDQEEARVNGLKNAAANARKARVDKTLKNVGKAVAVGSLAAGPVSLAADAAAGEHLSSSEVLNDMLVQPAVAALGMVIGVEIGFGITKAAAAAEKITIKAASKLFTTRLASYTIGALGGALPGSIISAAAHKEDFRSGKTWENIGISMGIAAGVAIVTAAAPSVKNGMVRAYNALFQQEFSSSESGTWTDIGVMNVNQIETRMPSGSDVPETEIDYDEIVE